MANIGPQSSSLRRTLSGMVHAIFALTLFAIFVIAWLVQGGTITLPEWAKAWNNVSADRREIYTAVLIPVVLILALLFFFAGFALMIRNNLTCTIHQNMASFSQESPFGPDWVLSNNSNAHCCADIGWFSEYTPFDTNYTDLIGSKLLAKGVGTVELSVKRSLHISGERAHSILRLTEVLYVPNAPANIVGNPIFEQYPDICFGHLGEIHGSIKDHNGEQVAYMVLNKAGLLAFELSGPPIGPQVGQSRLKAGINYILHVIWPDSERRRWKVFQANHISGPSLSDLRGQAANESESYNPAEKQWLKHHYGGEFKFLLTHGLKIDKDEDREEGRRLLRALIEGEQ
ncbi:hypothetical protein F4804DRAFT_338386 [Jackrogersella minutella]|nr:hypothetical protein F4804DRAFT_338386 [Jackrogersella minutella]